MKIINPGQNFLLVSIIPQKTTDEQALDELQELKALVEAYGGKVKDLVVQQREVHDKGMYIGKGKIEEVASVVKEQKIDVVVLNAIAKSNNLHEIKRILEKENSLIQVWDRVDLILEIFAKHAKSAEAKLQIEMAAMKHMGPRIYGMGLVMSRQGGGIGTLGVGETNTELMKRHWRSQMKKVQDKIKKHTIERTLQLEKRAKSGLQTASIIGYTNAGKTSLFNTLTGKKNIVQNALFVTLDSSTGKVYLKNLKKEILLTDTIGFIRNLPPSLIDAFKSTLLESMHADVLLVVIDASDKNLREKINVVEEVLYGLRAEDKKRIYVFNKMDAADNLIVKELEEEYKEFTPLFISVKKHEGIEKLLTEIDEVLKTPSEDSKTPNKRKPLHY